MKPPTKSEARPWRLADPLWHRIEAVLDAVDPPKATGRPRGNRRLLLEGILYRLRTGGTWRSLPRAYGDDSTIHRAYHRWDEDGALAKIRDLVTREHPEFRTLAWAWEPPPGPAQRLRRSTAL